MLPIKAIRLKAKFSCLEKGGETNAFLIQPKVQAASLILHKNFTLSFCKLLQDRLSSPLTPHDTLTSKIICTNQETLTVSRLRIHVDIFTSLQHPILISARAEIKRPQ